jgi:hypothetical protein
MGVRSFNVTPVSHFVKAEPLEKYFFFTKKVSAYCEVPNYTFDEFVRLSVRLSVCL